MVAQVVVLDGPEAVGKSSIARELLLQGPESVALWEWRGPADPDWTCYRDALAGDLALPVALVVWSRSWASEVVYDRLMERNRLSPEDLLGIWALDRVPGVTRAMVIAPSKVLRARREERLERGETGDLAVSPPEEREAFLRYARTHHWTVVSGTDDPTEVARFLIEAAIRRQD